MLALPVAQLAGYALLALLNVIIRTPVVDQAGALPRLERAAIEGRLRGLRQQRGVQMAVITIRSTDGEPLAEFSHRTAVQWGGGHKGRNDGLLLTLAVADRRTRIEVGYGLESQLPDIAVRRILDSANDELRQRKYGPAVLKIINQIEAQLDAAPAGTAAVAPAARPAPAPVDPAADLPIEAAAVNSTADDTVDDPPPPEPPPPPTPPLGPLVLAPLVGMFLGYKLGSWRCAERTSAVDCLAIGILAAVAVLCLLWATGDLRGLYLAVSLGALGWSNMVARTFGLTRMGCVVAAMAAGAVSLGVFVYLLLTIATATTTDASLQRCLIIALAAGTAVQMVSAWVISEFFDKTALWSPERARYPHVYGTGSGSEHSGSWSSGNDSRGGSGGGSGSGGGDWGGGGVDFGGGGADGGW